MEIGCGHTRYFRASGGREQQCGASKVGDSRLVLLVSKSCCQGLVVVEVEGLAGIIREGEQDTNDNATLPLGSAPPLYQLYRNL